MKDLKQFIDEAAKSYSAREIFNAKKYLEQHLKDFELDGCEISEEDALYMLDLMKRGMNKDKAMETVLNGISDCLD